MTYNGWSNYETWAVALWLDNDPSTYAERRRLDCLPLSKYADRLQHWVESDAPDLGASLYSDLLNAAISSVDWYELATAWHEDEEEET